MARGNEPTTGMVEPWIIERSASRQSFGPKCFEGPGIHFFGIARQPALFVSFVMGTKRMGLVPSLSCFATLLFPKLVRGVVGFHASSASPPGPGPDGWGTMRHQRTVQWQRGCPSFPKHATLWFMLKTGPMQKKTFYDPPKHEQEFGEAKPSSAPTQQPLKHNPLPMSSGMFLCCPRSLRCPLPLLTGPVTQPGPSDVASYSVLRSCTGPSLLPPPLSLMVDDTHTKS